MAVSATAPPLAAVGAVVFALLLVRRHSEWPARPTPAWADLLSSKPVPKVKRVRCNVCL